MICSIYIVHSIDVNDGEHFNAEPRLLVITADSKLPFSEEKKRAQAELRL